MDVTVAAISHCYNGDEKVIIICALLLSVSNFTGAGNVPIHVHVSIYVHVHTDKHAFPWQIRNHWWLNGTL